MSSAPNSSAWILLHVDPDRSARALRASLPSHPAVVITDSFRARVAGGRCEVAIGIAGLRPLEDWRGLPDSAGREMHATVIAIADEAAAAADLVRSKDSRVPALRIRGLQRHVSADDRTGVAALLRRPEDDPFYCEGVSDMTDAVDLRTRQPVRRRSRSAHRTRNT